MPAALACLSICRKSQAYIEVVIDEDFPVAGEVVGAALGETEAVETE
jgi:hypothetical protein